jgi:zinc protease
MAEHATHVRVGGVDVIVYRTSTRNVISLAGYMPVGDTSAANPAIPTLTGMMLDRGTVSQDQFRVAQQLEDAGASLQFAADRHGLYIDASLRRQNLALVVSLLGEQLRTPAFSKEEFEKARLQFVGRLRQQQENVGYRAFQAFALAAYPVGHPNRLIANDELIRAAQSATVGEARAFHRAHYGPAYLTLIVVGDVDATEVERQVKRAFSSWKGGAPLALSLIAPAAKATTEVVQIADKPSATVLIGQPTGLRYRDPDALALRVAMSVLGSGFTGRLMNTLRDQEGLTYGVYADLSGDTFNDGEWMIRATFAPQLLDKGVASAQRELLKWWREGVTAEELARRKQSIVGSYQVGLASTSGLADTIRLTVERGYGLSWLDEYPLAIRALTLEQVNAAIHAHVDPQRLIVIEAGTVG